MQALGDFLYQELPKFLTTAGPATSLTYNQVINSSFLASRTVAPARRDPLILDLDNDGLETVGINTTTPILFDHTGTGLKTATGWVNPDDAFLVLDRNGNNTIDSGKELFGDATALYAGGTAADGFAALAQEDTNHDGLVNASDARFASLRLWRDLNQDGISQTGELFTLASQGITALNVASTANSQFLPNGNQIADLGGFVRSDGSSGTLGAVEQLAEATPSTANSPTTSRSPKPRRTWPTCKVPARYATCAKPRACKPHKAAPSPPLSPPSAQPPRAAARWLNSTTCSKPGQRPAAWPPPPAALLPG
jgi:hypothetical protein